MEKKEKGKVDDSKSVELANIFKLIQGLGIIVPEDLISEMGKRQDEKLNEQEANALRNLFPRKQDYDFVSTALPEDNLNDHQQASSSTKQAKLQRKYLKQKNKKKNQLKIANQQASQSLANVNSNDTESEIANEKASDSLSLSGMRTESLLHP